MFNAVSGAGQRTNARERSLRGNTRRTDLRGWHALGRSALRGACSALRRRRHDRCQCWSEGLRNGRGTHVKRDRAATIFGAVDHFYRRRSAIASSQRVSIVAAAQASCLQPAVDSAVVVPRRDGAVSRHNSVFWCVHIVKVDNACTLYIYCTVSEQLSRHGRSAG
jgi:hypothetical protein